MVECESLPAFLPHTLREPQNPAAMGRTGPAANDRRVVYFETLIIWTGTDIYLGTIGTSRDFQ